MAPLRTCKDNSTQWSHARSAWAFDPTRHLLFTHIPKSGGTSIAQAMRNAMTLSLSKNHMKVSAPDKMAREVVCCTPPGQAKQDNLAHFTEAYALGAIKHCLKRRPATAQLRAERVVSFAVLREPVALRISAWRWLRAPHGWIKWPYARSFER